MYVGSATIYTSSNSHLPTEASQECDCRTSRRRRHETQLVGWSSSFSAVPFSTSSRPRPSVRCDMHS